MEVDVGHLRAEGDRALAEGRPGDAACYLAELTVANPDDRQTRVALAIALGDAGNPVGALRILRSLADRLAQQGFLLPALIVIRHGLERVPDDTSLLNTLRRIHVRGARAKAGQLNMPPPLKTASEVPDSFDLDALLAMPMEERLEKLTEIGTNFPALETTKPPVPMPLFSELDDAAFIETVKRLSYKRYPDAAALLKEGAPGDSLLIVADGEVSIRKQGKQLATLRAGTVMGEMALITGAPRSAEAVAMGEVEILELMRSDVEALAKSQPQVAEELVAYCRRRLIANLLRTSPVFQKFDEETRHELIEKFGRRSLNAGDTLIQQGTPGEGLYLIAAGELEVSIKGDDGEPVVVATLGPGQVVGEISLLKDQPTTATVRAKQRGGVLFLPRADFTGVLDKNPDVKAYVDGLGEERLKASQSAREEEIELLDDDDLIVL